jgi:hypothetical protein
LAEAASGPLAQDTSIFVEESAVQTGCAFRVFVGSTTGKFRQLHPPRLVPQQQSSSKWLAPCYAPRSLLSGARTFGTTEYNRDEKQRFVLRPIVPAFSRITAWATETKSKLHFGQRSPCAAARYPRQAIHGEVWRSCSFLASI